MTNSSELASPLPERCFPTSEKAFATARMQPVGNTAHFTRQILNMGYVKPVKLCALYTANCFSSCKVDLGLTLVGIIYRPACRICLGCVHVMSVALGWHGVANATPGQQNAIFVLPLRIFQQFFYRCFVFVAKERYPRILVEINLCGKCCL